MSLSTAIPLCVSGVAGGEWEDTRDQTAGGKTALCWALGAMPRHFEALKSFKQDRLGHSGFVVCKDHTGSTGEEGSVEEMKSRQTE